MNASEPPVRHQHDHVALAMLAGNEPDDGVHLGDMAGAPASRPQIVDKLVGGQALRLGKGRSEDASDDHLVGKLERGGEILLEHAAA